MKVKRTLRNNMNTRNGIVGSAGGLKALRLIA